MSPEHPESGIVKVPSPHSVDDTVHRLEQALATQGIRIFATIDHSGEAEKVGLQMPNTKLLIFGNPKGGTPLMLAAPTIALDLPLKILIHEDPEGHTWLTYSAPEFLAARHGLPANLQTVLAGVAAIASEITS